MKKPAFYDKEKAQSREDFFRNNAQTASFVSDLFFNLIYGGVSAEARILDIGTGNAFVLEQLAKRNPGRYRGLWGIDISPEMLKKAEERTSGLDIRLVLGDNLALPFEPCFFDAVTAKNVTNFSESEIYRVLKSPGKFFFREYSSGKGLKEIAEMFRERVVRARDPSFYTRRLKSAGFRNIALIEIDVKREYSFEELLQVMQMFPFLDQVREEDKAKIRDYFGSRDKAQITSDQIIIIGDK
ncbi:class I SAM-dependent methyltransferase [Candidatus Pacearchaeota archaeon]|nr:class I SAM-dependent methyltransferase [Candidatus Pacearchaeota archaeon]